MLLLALVACGPTAPAAGASLYEACTYRYAVACDCEDSTLVAREDGAAWVCGLTDDEVAAECLWANPDVCDPASDVWDEDRCTSFEADFDTPLTVEQACVLRELADTCDYDEAVAACE